MSSYLTASRASRTASMWLALFALSHCATNENAAAPPQAPASSTPSGQAEHAQTDKAAPNAIIAHIGSGSKAFPVDRKAYENVDYTRLPIGVFDSGVGGLSVLSAILTIDEFDNRTHEPRSDGVPDFQDERFVYYGDQANMPYGHYPSVGKEDFLRELVIEDAAFLLGNRYWPAAESAAPMMDKPLVKAVVVACNTATAYGINDLRKAFEAWNIPMILIGVVEAGSEGALASMKQQGQEGAVAVMATVGTCKSEAYPRTIEKFSRARGVTPPKVVQQGSVGLAGAIEGDPSFVRSSAATSSAANATPYQGPAVGNKAAPLDPAMSRQYSFDPAGLSGDASAPASVHLNSVENYVKYDVASLLEDYRRAGASTPIRAVVLGCTHFPFQREQISAAFERLRTFKDDKGAQPYEKLVSPHVELVDPAKLTAKQLYLQLIEKGRLRDKAKPQVLEQNAFFISKPNATLPGVKLTADGTLDASYKYGRRAGDFEVETVKRVPLRAGDLTPELQSLIQHAMPAVWESLQTFQTSRWVSR